MKRRQNEPDGKADDGVFCDGWRRVRSGGKIKVAKGYYQDDRLIPWVGDDVFCSVPEYWFSSIICHIDSRGRTNPHCFICEAKSV